MEFSEYHEMHKKMKGYEEQEILIDMLSEKMGEITGMQAGTLKLFVSQALMDSLEKRKMPFKKIKYATQEEKTKFVDEIVINTVKRAKLVASVDEIIIQCHKVYEDWKHKYRPEEV